MLTQPGRPRCSICRKPSRAASTVYASAVELADRERFARGVAVTDGQAGLPGNHALADPVCLLPHRTRRDQPCRQDVAQFHGCLLRGSTGKIFLSSFRQAASILKEPAAVPLLSGVNMRWPLGVAHTSSSPAQSAAADDVDLLEKVGVAADEASLVQFFRTRS